MATSISLSRPVSSKGCKSKVEKSAQILQTPASVSIVSVPRYIAQVCTKMVCNENPLTSFTLMPYYQ